ncbi:hypothetical protein C1645_825783 [Glomus cerebriforme]|uniref:Uncharacterized protein n=1 Tax=Glomus cerebriforme TaxID=658196 RepID=A0A397SVZ8_9GLOM|nr:hypothetical protein C1645_825783 [Glomus cerebriforme]
MEHATNRNEMFTTYHIKEWLDFKQIFANIINNYSFNNFNITHRPMIFYLLWWDISGRCAICKLEFKFISDCQKWCIIRSRKCKRILTISIDTMDFTSENEDIDDLIYDTRFNIKNYHNITNIISC